MSIDYLVSAFVTLFIAIDPVGLVPPFLAVTPRMSATDRYRVAIRACLIAFTVLAVFALAGNWVLDKLSITLPAFRIAGGLLLFSVAFDMVVGQRTPREASAAEQALEEHVRHIAAFPLAIPLMAGPGAITATLLLAGQAETKPFALAMLLLVAVAVIGLCFGTFIMASRIDRLIGMTGNIVLSRLFGIILAALAVQYVIDGVRAVFKA